MRPLLSIVIANYNYGRFLEEAIQSVITQNTGDKVELIICDAASTDNSVDIIRKYAGGLPPNTSRADWHPSDEPQTQNSKPETLNSKPETLNSKLETQNTKLQTLNSKLITWWCSEKDGGQSAAFNKGFSLARGEWLTWLNADDFYFPGTFEALFKVIRKHPGAEWITGNKVHFDSDSGRIISVNWGPHLMPPLLSRNHASSASFGPSSFFKKDLYLRIGGIDEKMHYAMDTEYWARATMAGARQIRLRHFCWAFRNHEESKTAGAQPEAVAAKRAKETAYWREKTGYTYRHDFTNPWYWLWVLWRVLDGSFFVRQILKMKYEGKAIHMFKLP